MGIVASVLATPMASSPAAAQQADTSCPPSFGPLLLEPGYPDGTFGDGWGGSTCGYRNGADNLLISVKWVEVQETAILGDLCGAPRKDRRLGSGNPPAELASFEVPSATHIARLTVMGSHLDDNANWPAAEEFGREYLAQFERTALPLPCPGVETTSRTCTVIARDAIGRAVPGARILLDGAGGETRRGVSDAKGRATFADVPVGSRVTGTVVLEDGTHDPPWFDITDNGFTMSASSVPGGVGATEACTIRVFATAQGNVTSEHPGPERWPDAVEVFLNTRSAFRLAELSGPVTYLPLHIHAFCNLPALGCDTTNPSAPGAFAVVAHTTNEEPNPYVALLDRFSGRKDSSKPDNREFHEIGHWFQANLLGGRLPYDCPAGKQCGHAGYYANATSTSAWVEGFASFYALMVNKHVVLRSYPELYRMYGTLVNLERDIEAWGAAGTLEEFAVTGILLDLEDGPGDYQKQAQPAPSLRVSCCEIERGVATGYVENEESADNGRAARDVRVTVTLADGSTKEVTTVPGDVPGGNFARFAFAATEAPPGGFRAVARLGRNPTGSDDDAVTVPLQEIFSTIRDHQGTKGVPVFNVSELHDMAKAAWGGDRDGNGLDDVDEIFISHGFFDDAKDPVQTWQPGDAVGPSSHQGNQLYPAIIPRPHAEVPDALRVVVDTGGEKATVLLDVAVPEGTEEVSTVTEVVPDEDGRVLLDLPREGSGATITVLAMADGRQPVVAGRLAADEVWAQADEKPDQPAATFEADIAGSPEWSVGPGSSRGRTLQLALIALGTLAALLIGRSLVTRRRRPALAAASPSTVLPPPPPRPAPAPRPVSVAPPPSGPSAAPVTSAPGWYPDPTRRFDFRYWDGRSWTPHTSTAGHPAHDPL